jgi:hypothetical protein
MTRSLFDRHTFFSLDAIGIGSSVIGLRTGWAQNATLTDTTGVPHPAHMHAGTCEELGDVGFPLNDVTTTRCRCHAGCWCG